MNCRILAISDIHTHWRVMDRLLKKANYAPGVDFLVVVGDVLQHGSDNIKALEYVIHLAENDRVYVLMGNNDIICSRMAYTYEFDRFRQAYDVPYNAFKQMAHTVGFEECCEDNWLQMREAVLTEYSDMLEFVRDLPTCVETEEHIFVHAGLENCPDWQNTSDKYAITVPWFMREQNPTDKWLVVGHNPVYNYPVCNATNLPVFDCDKKIIGIDGGMTIKQAGQINLLIITKQGSEYSYETLWDTDAPKATVTNDFASDLKPLYVDWLNHDIEVLDDSDYFVKVRDNVTKYEGLVAKNQIYYFDDKPHIYLFMSSFPTVKKDDEVFVFSKDEKAALVTASNGQVGWIPIEIIE